MLLVTMVMMLMVLMVVTMVIFNQLTKGVAISSILLIYKKPLCA